MKILVSIASQLAENILSRVCKYCIYHKDPDKHMRILMDKWQYLERLKVDVVSRMRAQLLPGKTPKAEVICWLEDIERMQDKIEAIEREAGKMCFSCAFVGKHTSKKIMEVEELCQRCDFTDGLVIDPPIREILPTPTLRGGSTIERIKKEILACMLDDNVGKIGVYGMRGIGKTTIMQEINNLLLQKEYKFDIVVWVTVSNTFSVFQLQKDIASKLGLDLAEFDDLRIRAAKLNAKLEQGRFVLILDDIWKAFALEHVGIPEPNYENGCKLVLTTRFLSVCNEMSCKHIPMQLFSKEETQKLFVEYLGYNVFDIPDLKPIVEEVLEQCGGLPLAIIMIAQSCKPLIHDKEWRDKLETLRNSRGIYESLDNVSDSLFLHSCGLEIHDLSNATFLDLSNTAIESLPDSVLSLDNLTALTLRGCRNLKLVPSLAKLVTLNKLDLGQTGITEVPQGLEMLVGLRYLSLNAPELKIMPLGIIPRLSRLQYLTVFWHSKYVTVNEKEIESLKKLETFGGHFKDMHEFRMFIKSLENRPLACYEIRVGMSGDGNYLIGEISGKSVILGDCCLKKSFELPKDVQYLEIKRCHDITSLCDVPSLNDTSEIKHLGLFLCTGIEHILCFASSSSSCTHSLQTLEILELCNLDNLHVLFRKIRIEEAGSSHVPRDTFSCLKRILICNCSKIKKLLPPGLLLHLRNLEEIWISFCEKLEEIAEEEKEGMDTIKITLPSLKILHLSGLPELKTICSEEIVCYSLEKIEIHGCPKLKRLPLFLPVLNGQLSPPPYLQKIETSEERWESLEWNHRNTKNVL